MHYDLHSNAQGSRAGVVPAARRELVMTISLKNVKIAPKGMGLNDFVASHEGFFAAEGLHVQFDWKTFRGTQSSWKDAVPPEFEARPWDFSRFGRGERFVSEPKIG